MGNLMSVGQIAKHFNDEIWRVEYILRSRRIKPLGKLGNANIYGAAAVRLVGEALKTIREKKGDAREEIAHA
jgi:hypothetical protein